MGNAVQELTIRLLEEPADLSRLEAVIASIWDRDKPPVTSDLLRALAHSGNYVAGAYVDDDLVGGTIAFLGRGSNGVVLHSHITGVIPARQVAGAGYLLKQHQRAWALERGIKTITWTFDPLVRRNAYFNLAKLGAEAAEYKINFYGSMNDAINRDSDSDRLLVHWHVDVAKTAEVEGPNGAEPLLLIGPDGEPVMGRRNGVLWCRVPEDVVSLRVQEPELASRWRGALRETLGQAMIDGYRVTGFSKSGWYRLTK